MSFGNCPKCKAPATRSLFKASCDTCQVQLQETSNTKVLLLLIPVVIFLIALFLALPGTKEIVSTVSKPDIQAALFNYWSQLLIISSVLSAILALITRQLFANYEVKNSNT